ncbi:hypothetical protein B0H12DRAFT_304667 [Mycena haematopus]|nr:hypothetical protein B0H12DRAFT_304667 [Mycena haematopus]
MYPGLHIAGARKREAERGPFLAVGPQYLLRLLEDWERIRKHPTRVLVLLGCVAGTSPATCVNAEDCREYNL